MRPLSFFSFLFLLISSTVGSRIFKLFYLDGLVAFSAGTPPQPLFGLLLPSTDRLVVVDGECGQKRADCPRFCQEELWADLCSPLCGSNGRCHFYSGRLDRLNYSMGASSSVRVLDEKWMGHFSFYSRQFGRLIEESVAFPFPSDDPKELKMSNVQLVDGLQLDARLLGAASGIVGLAAGGRNFVDELFDHSRIPRAAVSIAAPSNVVLVGTAEGEGCANWARRPAFHPHWIFSFDSALFDDRKWTEDVLTTFSFRSERIFIPDEEFDSLVARRILLFDTHNPAEMYGVRCNAALDLRFTAGEREFVMPSGSLIWMNRGQRSCYTPLAPVRDWYGRPRLYADEPNWILSLSFFRRFCVSFDYERMEVGIADAIQFPLSD